MRRLAAHYHVPLKVGACLVLFTAWFSWWFVPSLAARYRPASSLFGDRAVGQNVAFLLEMLPPHPPGNALVVFLVGDSTVAAGRRPEEDQLPWMLRRELRARFPDRQVEVIDFSFAGLYAPDAFLLAAKAFATKPDLVVYALSPRVVPTAPATPWATGVGDLALQWDVVTRIGLRDVLALVPPQSIARTLVLSLWPPVRLRALLGAGATRTAERLSPRLGALARHIFVQPPVVDFAIPVDPARDYLASRQIIQLSPPTRSTRALDGMIRLCATEKRCLLYHTPVNPDAIRYFEPGLLDDFVAYVHARTTGTDVPFVDLRNAAPPDQFTRRPNGTPDGIHLTPAGYTTFAPQLATRVVDRLHQLDR